MKEKSQKKISKIKRYTAWQLIMTCRSRQKARDMARTIYSRVPYAPIISIRKK